VIGAGRIAQEHLAFFTGTARAQLVGVCDLDPLLASRAARVAGGVDCATDHRAMLHELHPDVVHITTPVDSHMTLLDDALESGVKLVIVEKPAGASLEQAHAMVAAAERSASALSEDHNYRFNPPVSELLRVVEGGMLGRTREVQVRMAMPLASTRYSQPLDAALVQRRPGGVLSEFLPHLSYLALLFAPGAKLGDVRFEKRDPSTPLDPDGLWALLESPGDSDSSGEGNGGEGGVRVELSFASGVAPATTSILIRGELGWAEADLQNPYVRVSTPRNVGNALSPLADQLVSGLTFLRAGARGLLAKLEGSPIYSGIPRFLDATYRAYATGDSLPVTHRDVLEAARVSDELTARLP
jgi:predicted dehydrogenase